MELGLVNAFLSQENLSESEMLLKNNVVGLNDLLQKLTAERAAATENLQRKEQEFLKVSGALENQMSVVTALARQKGLEPLLPPPQEQEATEVQE